MGGYNFGGNDTERTLRKKRLQNTSAGLPLRNPHFSVFRKREAGTRAQKNRHDGRFQVLMWGSRGLAATGVLQLPRLIVLPQLLVIHLAEVSSRFLCIAQSETSAPLFQEDFVSPLAMFF